jgi:tetratricopeptide (TPR) repeat protein
MKKGLNILELRLDENYTKGIVCLNNISLVYRMEENYSKAFDCYQKSLDIEKRYLTADHSDFGQIYHNIDAIY